MGTLSTEGAVAIGHGQSAITGQITVFGLETGYGRDTPAVGNLGAHITLPSREAGGILFCGNGTGGEATGNVTYT